MNRNLSLGGVVWMMILAFTATATASASAEVIDRIVAVVNEDIILLSELKDQMTPYVQRIRQQGLDEDQERQMLYKVREEMINRLVDEKLTDQEIERNDIQVEEAEIDNTIERIKSANSFTDEDLRRFLEREGKTMEQYRSNIKEQVLRSRLVNYQVKSKIVVTEEEMRDYYDRHTDEYGGETRYHLRNILMRPPDFATDAEREAVHERMQQIRLQIEAGEPFADLARATSQNPVAGDGGDIGEFGRETLSPQIREALDGLKPGETTEVLDTDQGFQLFYVEAIHQTEGMSFDSVKEEIHQQLYNEVVDQKFISWLEDLRSHSHIKIIN